MNLASPMTTTVTTYKHIRLNQNGVPYIVDTTMKVVELVLAQQAHGWSPEELHFQHPYLSMSQIHSALAYYWEHKEALDNDMVQRSAYVAEAMAEAGASPLARRLRQQGLLE